MDEISGPIVLFILLLIISFLIPYSLARKRSKDFRKGKRKYNLLSNNLLQLKEHVVSEADRWPIYARPVLFTEDDHKAQVEFARAQQALLDADEILPSIETIDEPETSEQFRLNDLINVPRNLRTISLGDRLLENVSALEQHILNLKNSLRSLRSNRKQVEKKRLEIEQSIQMLRKRTEQVGRRLKPLDVWKSIEAHNLSWLINMGDRCQSEAYNSVMSVSDTEQGYIEHARADIFVSIGNISLDCIELFLESQMISRRYELDKFKKLFNESTSFLQLILEMDDVWNSWKKLKKVKPYIDELPATRQAAEKSLRSFKNRQKHLMRLITLVGNIDVTEAIKLIEEIEGECTSYWYSYTERKTYWERALGSPARLPSTEINSLQALLVTQINPEIDVDMVIKQSRMLRLIKTIGDALERYESIKLQIQQLKAELNVHKEAQKLVNRLLANDGEATLSFKRLEVVLVDTSPDNSDWGKVLISDYKDYQERARIIQGADFPELLNSIYQFTTDSERLVIEHHSQLQSLENSYDDLYEYIDSMRYELETYINHIPRFERDSVAILENIFQQTLIVLEQQKTLKYSWLRDVVNKMQVWVEKADLHVQPARNKYDSFERGKSRVEQLLIEMKDAIDFNKGHIEEAWKWSKNEILPRTRAISRAFDLKRKDWNRIIERNWVDYNISRSIIECENLIQFLESKLSELHQVVEKANQKQAQLEDKASDIERLLEKNSHKLTNEDLQQSIYLLELAQRAATYDFADKSLNHAHKLVIRQATDQARNEIRKIIIDSGGGPIFLSPVSNMGKITGAFKMVQGMKQRKSRKK